MLFPVQMLPNALEGHFKAHYSVIRIKQSSTMIMFTTLIHSFILSKYISSFDEIFKFSFTKNQ